MKTQSARQPPQLSLISASDIAQKLNIKRAPIERKIKELELKRNRYEIRWRAIRDYQLPYIGQFNGLDDEDNAASRKDYHIYNGCSWECNQIFASGVMSGLTPPSRKWFRFNFANKELEDNTELGRLLDQRIDIVNDVLEKSNFYTAVHSCYLELAFGQAPLGIFPDARYGVHFVPYTTGTYMLENGPDGTVDVFAMRKQMSARQIVDKFGAENAPAYIRNELDNGPGFRRSHKVIWYVEPNTYGNPLELGGFNLPYLSVYYVEGSEQDSFLHIGGFHEFPVPVARYLLTGNDSYGKGPGWFAEGDSKSLQLMQKDLLTMVELTVKPPMGATADLGGKGINLVPGGKTYMRQQGAITPLFQVGGNLEHLQSAISTLEGRIKRAYSADLFMMLDQMDNKTMTAREVIERNQEKMTMLGPVVQRMQFEFLSKIIERVYNILDRARVFPEPEDEELLQQLAREEIKIEYISPLAQAQKMSGLVNIEQAIGFIANAAQFNPDILDKVDWNEAVNRYFELLGAPAAIKRTDDEYSAIQEQKAEQQAQAQQMQQMQQAAQMAAPAAQAAKNATEAARDGNPALMQIMGMDDLGYGQQ